MILGPSDVLRITSSLAGMGNDSLDNQHLEYEQFFVMQTSDERDDNNKDQISSDHSTKLLRVMAEHKSLLQKVNKTQVVSGILEREREDRGLESKTSQK